MCLDVYTNLLHLYYLEVICVIININIFEEFTGEEGKGLQVMKKIEELRKETNKKEKEEAEENRKKLKNTKDLFVMLMLMLMMMLIVISEFIKFFLQF